jgi:hypothetical protein
MGVLNEKWGSTYRIGAIVTFIVLAGVVLDMVVVTITGGNVAELPQTAIDRFSQFRESPLLGLYNLDLLNIINQLILIPAVFALYAAHRESTGPSALLALILFLVGTTIFVCGNTALTMLDLSHRYHAAASEEQKLLIAAAGEAMLTKGSHGSLGVFIGFVLPTFANFLMSAVMLKGKIFSRLTAYTGLIGNSLMLLYLILVTFSPAVESLALIFAMPGGLLLMAWMIMYAIRLIKLSRS